MSDQPAPYNPSNPKHVKHRKRLEQKWGERVSDGVRFVLSDRRGRDLMYWLIDELGFYKDSAAATDSGTNRFVGMRAGALKIYQKCEEIAPREWGLTLSEHYEERYQDAVLDAAVRTESADEKNGGQEAN